MSSTADRLLSAATRLFAERGYEGTSVRAICAEAEANLNAVSYHFSGKQGLYAHVIRGAGERLTSASRLLDTPAADASELRTRLVLFGEETLASWLEAPEVLTILMAELQQGFRNAGPETFAELATQAQALETFLRRAAGDGVLRDDADIAILSGALLERLNTQVMFADTVRAQYGVSIVDPAYRRHWVKQTVDMFLFGAVGRPS